MQSPEKVIINRGIFISSVSVILMPFLVFGISKFVNALNFPVLNVDWLWCLSCVFGSILLSTRLKIGWLGTMALIFIITVTNDYLYVTSGENEASTRAVFQIIFSLVNFIVLILVGYFYRYPYLDRRDTLFFGIADRFICDLPAEINGKDSGNITSISISGVLFKSSGPLKIDRNNRIILSVPELGLDKVQTDFVSTRGNDLRLKFRGLSVATILNLKKNLKKFAKED